MHFEGDGCRFELKGEQLVIVRDGLTLMRLPLIPATDGEKITIGAWRTVGKDHFAARLRGLGVAHLAWREGHACYWVETERRHLPKLRYFPDSHPTDSGWHTFLSDEFDRRWSLDENADVPHSSAYVDMHVDKEDGAGMTDPGDKPPTWIWNVPARAFAIETPAGWLGMSIPGPLSVAVTRMTMQRGTFNLTFEELRPTAKEWGPPRVYFIPGLRDPYDALDQHRLISKACGLMQTKVTPHPEWWSYPSYAPGDQVFRLNGKRWVLHDDGGNFTSYLTTENLEHWVERVQNYAGCKGMINLNFDQLFYRGYGSRRVISCLGGVAGLRTSIDTFRAQGTRTGLYMHLCLLDPSASTFPAEHPEAICKPKDPLTKIFHGCLVGAADLVYVDWTHPVGREQMLDYIEFLLSDRPGCLNADWLLINNNLSPDPRRFEFHDPDWGTGDLMTMKMTQLAYEHAKKIKPDCYVRRVSPGDLYMQPYCDQFMLCEEWNGQTTAWYKRAHIATRVAENCIPITDSWFITLTKLAEYYFGLSAVCQPEIVSVDHAIHPYMHWREMRPRDYRRIRAGIQTYLNAPVRKGDECRVNFSAPEALEIWRKHSAGPLAGWYAAIGLHKRCLVTYSETEARVAASQERKVTVPLPPRAKLTAVKAISHEGVSSAHPYENSVFDGQPAVTLWVPDAAEEIMYVCLAYDLA